MATFGNTSAGGVNNNLNHNPASGPNTLALLATSPANMGTVTNISGYFSGSGSNTLAIWNSSGNLIANSAIGITVSGTGFVTATYGTAPILLPSTQYFLGYVSGSLSAFYYVVNGTNGGDTYIGGSTTDSTATNITNPAFSNTSGQGNGNGGAFYVTYTPASSVTAHNLSSLGVGA